VCVTGRGAKFGHDSEQAAATLVMAGLDVSTRVVRCDTTLASV